MNKAFTRESDYDPTAELIVRPLPVLPAGVKNYITPAGAEALRRELDELAADRLPQVLGQLSAMAEAGLQEEREHKVLQVRRRQIEEQIRHLRERLSTLEVVASRTESDGPVRFGDRVVAEDPDGNEHSYTIVGVDEADPGAGRISWITPLAKALLGAEVGDEVVVRRPRGDLVLEVTSIAAG